MIRYFYRNTKSEIRTLEELSESKKGAWVYVENPTDTEIKQLVDKFDLEEGHIEDALERQADPLVALARPLSDRAGLDEDRDQAPNPSTREVLGALGDVAQRLLGHDFERELLEVARVGAGIDARAPDRGVGREVRARPDAREQIRRGHVTLGGVGSDHVVDLAVAVGVGRVRRHRDHPAASNHLVARGLGLDEALVDLGLRLFGPGQAQIRAWKGRGEQDSRCGLGIHERNLAKPKMRSARALAGRGLALLRNHGAMQGRGMQTFRV